MRLEWCEGDIEVEVYNISWLIIDNIMNICLVIFRLFVDYNFGYNELIRCISKMKLMVIFLLGKN